VKRTLLFCACALTVLLIFCKTFSAQNKTWPPHIWNQKDYGSFSPETTYSFDGKYYAVQSIDNGQIAVSVYSAQNDSLVSSFAEERAFDFWGICWENDSYNIWIQSGDVGTYCMVHDSGKWSRDDGNMLMPPEIIDRFRMQNGSFEYVRRESPDGRFIASASFVPNGVCILSAETGKELYRYSPEGQYEYKGHCWDEDGNLFLRYDSDKLLILKQNNGKWTHEAAEQRPDEIVLYYDWDGTAR